MAVYKGQNGDWEEEDVVVPSPNKRGNLGHGSSYREQPACPNMRMPSLGAQSKHQYSWRQQYDVSHPASKLFPYTRDDYKTNQQQSVKPSFRGSHHGRMRVCRFLINLLMRAKHPIISIVWQMPYSALLLPQLK